MKHFLIGLLLAVTCAYSFADVNTYGLTDMQKAELALQAEKMKNPAPGTVTQASDVALDATKKWAEAGKGLAVGIVAAAKEAGVAVNEFAATPVGKITTAIIVWKMLGKDILDIFLGFFFLLVLLPAAALVYRSAMTESVVRENKPILFGLFGLTRSVVVSRKWNTNSETTIPLTLCYIFLSVIMLIAGIVKLSF